MKTSRCRIAACSVAAAIVASAGVAQSPRFGEETSVVAVEIPVQVLVDGEPVRGLTKDDFEVSEGRKARPIVGFEVVDLTLARTENQRPVAVSTEIPAAGKRHFLLLFDLTNSEPSAISRARNAAERLVIDTLHPSDLVGVATWSYAKGPRLLLGFTTDRKQVEVAVESLGVLDIQNRATDPLGLQVAELDRDIAAAPAGAPAGRGMGAARDELFLENLREAAATERTASRQVKSNEIAALTQGFASLAQLMSNVIGRKYVVLLSQGFDSSLITGTTDTAVQEQAAQSSERGEVWNINSEERFGNTRSANKLEDMLSAFRRSDCAIQAVDIGGLAVGAGAADTSRASGRETLLTMAKDTGGQLYENFNNLGQAMGKMLEATSVTYVLTIQPDDLKNDGKFHDLKVKLRNGPSGARLVHRPGYYAPRPFEQRAGAEQRLDSAQLLLSGNPGGPLVAGVSAAAFRGEGGRMHVPVVIEVPGDELIAAKKGNVIPLAVYAYAFDAVGGIIDYVAQGLQLDAGKVEPRLHGEALRFVGDLLLPPGSYVLRTLVRVGESGAYWLGHDGLEVPAFAAGELAAVAPLAPTPMTKGLVVRAAGSEEKAKGLPFPFMIGQEFYLPDALATVARGGSERLVLNVYGLGAGDARISGDLTGDGGVAVSDAKLKVVSHVASDQPGLERFELALTPGSAAAGNYTLRITVEQGERKSVSYATLRVVS